MATVTDAFTGSGALSANWTPTNSAGSHNYSRSSDQLAGAATVNSGAYWNANAFTGDQYAQITVKVLPTAEWGTGPLVKYDSASLAGYYVFWKAGDLRVRNNFDNVDVITSTQAVAVNDVIKLTAEDSGANQLVKLWINGVQVGSTYSTTTKLTGTRIGFHTYAADTTFRADDFEGGDITTAPTYKPARNLMLLGIG